MLKYIYRFGQILVCATLFLPLIINDGFVFPFITPRNFLFRLLMSLGLGVIILLWLNLKDLRPKKNWLNIAVAAVVGAKFLSAIFGVNFYNSFWSSYERMEGVLAWLFFAIFYFLIITVFKKPQEWRWLFRISLIPALLVAVYGLGQAWGWSWVIAARQSRIEAQLGNAAYVGAYMVVNIGLALYLILQDKNIWWRLLAGVSIIPFHLALFYSATRGAGFGWIVGILLGSIFYLVFGKFKKIKLIIAAGLLFFVLIAGGIYGARNSDFVKNNEFLWRMTSINLSGTVKSRLLIWNMAWQGFQDRPIFGWGQDNFNYVFNKYYTHNTGEDWVDRAHNNLLDQLSMGGIVTFLAYLAVVIFPFYIFWRMRRKSPEKGALLVGWWVAYVVQNQFVFDSLNTYIYFFIILGFVLFNKNELEADSEQESSGMMAIYSTSYNYGIGIMLVIMAVVINMIFSWPGYKANRLTILSLGERFRNPNLSYSLLQEAMALNSFGNKEISLQTTTFAYDVVGNPNLTDDFKTKAVLLAIESLERATKREPEDVRVLLTLSSMYRTARVLDVNYLNKAEAVLEKIRQLSPGRITVYYDLAQVKFSQGDKKSAEEHLRKALALDADRLQSLVNLTFFLSNESNPEAIEYADKLINQHEDRLTEKDLAVVASVYFKFEMWDRAVYVLEKLTQSYPDNPSYWQQLGQVYQASGQLQYLPLIDKQLKKLDAKPLATSTEESL